MNMTDEQGVKWLLQKAYEDGYRYIAMGDGRKVFLFKNKPYKREYDWYDSEDYFGNFPMCICESFNQLISWKDEEPFDIGKYLGIVDWENVPVDTKVLVSDDGENWEKRHFKYYDKGNVEYKYVCFDYGRTSWSDNFQNITCSWKYCKLAEDE